MSKYPLIWGGMTTLLIMGFLLTACGDAATPAPTETSADTSSASPEVAPAATEEEAGAAATEETQAAVEQEAATTEEVTSPPTQAECTPVKPTEDITGFVNQYIETTPPNEGIAAVSDSDWVKGSPDAPVTIIEYGDFQ